MPCLPHAVLNRLDALVFKFWCALLCVFLLPAPLSVRAQTSCSAYDECAKLQGELEDKLQPPIVISINESSLGTMFDTEAERADFRNRLEATVATWASATGIDIRFATGGETANVRVSVSDSATVRSAAGIVVKRRPNDFSSETHDDFFISDYYSEWSPEGPTS